MLSSTCVTCGIVAVFLTTVPTPEFVGEAAAISIDGLLDTR